MRLRGIFLLLIVALLGMVVSFELLAQECSAEIEAALSSFSEVCTGLGAESACAGNSFSLNGEAAEAGSVLALSEVESAAGTSSGAEDYSLGALTVHANVPLALSASGLRYMLIGEAQISNAVDAASAFVPVEAIPVTTFVGSNLRAFPSTDGRVVASAAVGTELLAYGQSSDLQWLIVLNASESVWVSKQVVGVSGDGDLNSLPVIGSSTRSYMQSFNFSTNPIMGDCLGTPPSMLLIQGPTDFSSLIEVNGIEIRFSSTILLLTTAENEMQLIVLEGGANTNNLSVPAGFTMFIQLGNDGQVNGAWTGLRPIAPNERAILAILQNIPQAEGYAAIEIPSEGEVAQTLASINSASLGQVVTGPAAGQANCSSLRPTSPLGSMGNRPDQAFYWDGASGATSYKLTIYNDAGGAVSSVEINANSSTVVTSTLTDVIGGGTSFSWDVQALVNGQVACTSGRASVQRDISSVGVGQGGGGPAATPTACGWQGC